VPGEVAGDKAATRAFQAELTSPLVALLEVGQCIAIPASRAERITQVQVGAHHGVGVADLLGEATGLEMEGDRSVQLTKIVHAAGKDL
jgi:hypothetical protein